jgi:hypothetical protein
LTVAATEKKVGSTPRCGASFTRRAAYCANARAYAQSSCKALGEPRTILTAKTMTARAAFRANPIGQGAPGVRRNTVGAGRRRVATRRASPCYNEVNCRWPEVPASHTEAEANRGTGTPGHGRAAFAPGPARAEGDWQPIGGSGRTGGRPT